DGIRDRTVTGVQTCALPISIAEAVAKGQCILFLGAGVHYGPPAGTDPKYAAAYPEERRPPLGRALSVKLADESEYLKRFPGWDEIGRASCRERVEVGGVAGS